VARFLPPLIITEKLIKKAVEIFSAAVMEIGKGL